MLAAFIHRTGPPEVIEFGEFKDPVPRPDEVIVSTAIAGLNPIDCYARGGLLPGSLPFPWIPGRDLAGTVVTLGSPASKFRVGDRVWATNQGFGGRQGTCAELCAVEEQWLYPLPESVSLETAAAAALTGVTAHLGLVQRAQLKKGQSVFVRGAGGAVGSMVVQMAVALGAQVMASAGSDEKVAATLSHGACAAFNYHRTDVASELRRLMPNGFDLAWDTTREPDFDLLVGSLRERGQIILMAGRDAKPPFPVGPFYVKQCSMQGIIMLKMSAAEMAVAAGDLNNWMSSGLIRPTIAARLPLSRTAEAHWLQEQATLGLNGSLQGKIILHP